MRSKVGETVPIKELVLKYVYDVSCETFVVVVKSVVNRSFVRWWR